MQTGDIVLLMTFLQYISHQPCKETLILVHLHMPLGSCKYTEKELRQKKSQGLDPLHCAVSQQHLIMPVMKSKMVFWLIQEPSI